MVTKRQLLLDRLQAIYDRATSTPSSRTFFLSVFEYIELFDTDPILEQIWKTIVDIGNNDKKELAELEQKAYAEMRQVYQEIRNYCKQNNVTNAHVEDELNEFQAYEEGRLTSSQGPLKSRHGYLSYALMTLTEDESANHLEFCRKYGTINDKRRIAGWHFSPSFKLWEDARAKMDRIQLTKVWFGWDKLVLFYTLYRDYEKMQQGNIDGQKIFDAWNLSILMDEIKIALEEKRLEQGKTIYEFKHPDYLPYLQRLHMFAREALLTQDEEAREMDEKKRWTYDPSSGVLFLNGKVAQFKKNNLRAKILETMTKSDKAKKKSWSWDELVEEIEGIESPDPKLYKQKIYDAVKKANDYIASQTGITDFLRVDMNTSQINPAYLS
ncbi:MAG: hypothetical protein N2691_04975 [Patescibacteria group bacterium]|nr:hypothetical protein [Patescibacteria group bacterium]